MINTLRSEFIKLRTILAHWVLAVTAFAFPVVVVTLVAVFADLDFEFDSNSMASLIVGVVVVSAMLLGAMSAISLTSEYGHNTVRPTYAATPHRVRVVGAKIVVNVTTVALVTAVTVALSWLIASIVVSARDRAISLGDDEVLAPLMSVVVLSVSVTLFALGLGLIIRNSPATVTILLLWPLLIEGLLALVLQLIGWDSAGKWMPYQAAIEAATTSDDVINPDVLGRPMGLVYFAAVASSLIVIGVFLDHRRDA